MMIPLIGMSKNGVGNDSHTKSLLHMDGANNSTIFIDSAAGASHTWTAKGNVVITTSQYKFGDASCYPNANPANYILGDTDWNYSINTQDFTFDCWIYPTSGVGGIGDCIGPTYRFNFFFRNDAHYDVSFYYTPGDIGFQAGDGTHLTANNWHHVAVVKFSRDTPTLKLYVDGKFCAATYLYHAMDTFPNMGAKLIIGEWLNTYSVPYIDEYRITVGLARWTKNFTPPNREY